MKSIRTLIVDDEMHARRGLRTLLAGEHDIDVVGEAVHGVQAVERIRALCPDLVFLDVEMPEMSGLGVVEEVGPDRMPLVVFVTAYDQYAVSAFDASAVDYLLKPFTDQRFAAALDRVRRARGGEVERTLGGRLRQLLGHVRNDGMVERFTVKVGDTLEVHRADEIDWVEADEYYVKLHIGDKVHMVRQTMGSLEEQLPSDRFARIHRSTIVNLDRIVALEPLFQGDYTVVLHDGTRLRMSRRRRETLAGLLKSFS